MGKCKICHKATVPKTWSPDGMFQCDNCDVYVHFVCDNFNKAEDVTDVEMYYCPPCRSKSKNSNLRITYSNQPPVQNLPPVATPIDLDAIFGPISSDDDSDDDGLSSSSKDEEDKEASDLPVHMIEVTVDNVSPHMQLSSHDVISSATSSVPALGQKDHPDETDIVMEVISSDELKSEMVPWKPEQAVVRIDNGSRLCNNDYDVNSTEIPTDVATGAFLEDSAVTDDISRFLKDRGRKFHQRSLPSSSVILN